VGYLYLFIWDTKQGKNKLEYPTSMYSFDEEEGGIDIEGSMSLKQTNQRF
jgi:hypothetical protein